MNPPWRGHNDGGQRFAEIYRKRYLSVWRFFRGYRISDDDSHDLTQDTFIRFFQHFDEMRSAEEGPYLKTIARTILLNYIRYTHAGRRFGNVTEIDGREGFDLPDVTLDEVERITRERRLTMIYKAVDELVPRQRRRCLLLWLSGLSYQEIAAALRISVDAVKSCLRDAKRALREKLGSDVELPEGEP